MSANVTRECTQERERKCTSVTPRVQNCVRQERVQKEALQESGAGEVKRRKRGGAEVREKREESAEPICAGREQRE